MAEKAQKLVLICCLTTLGIVLYCILSQTNSGSTIQFTRNTFFVHLVNNQTNELDQKVSSSYTSKSYEDIWITTNRGLIVKRKAYLDLRDKSHTAVRFITLHDRRNKEDHPTLYAKLYYSNNKSTKCLSTKWRVGSYSTKPGGVDDYIHFLITTEDVKDIPIDSLAYATISTDSKCMEESVNILIHSIRAESSITTPYNYGVCLHKAISTEVQPQVLLDWVKLNIALGAETITLYRQTVPDTTVSILHSYINKGIVEVLDWKVEQPFIDSSSKHGGQTGVIADCIYHNMNKVKYLTLIDLDEFIIPQKYHTIPQLLNHLNEAYNGHQVASYVFWSVNMYDDDNPLPKISQIFKNCPNTSIPVYFKRTKSCINDRVSTRKIIVRPERVEISWVHNILKPSKGFKNQLEVPRKEGVMRHYRFNWNSFGRCPSKKNTTFIMTRYITDENVPQCITIAA